MLQAPAHAESQCAKLVTILFIRLNPANRENENDSDQPQHSPVSSLLACASSQSLLALHLVMAVTPGTSQVRSEFFPRPFLRHLASLVTA